jgi:hypothetical protein
MLMHARQGTFDYFFLKEELNVKDGEEEMTPFRAKHLVKVQHQIGRIVKLYHNAH